VGWRSLMISRPARLRREHFSLAIEQDETVTIPFEDIAVIVLNHRQIILTHPLLSACAEYGIALFSTDDKELPNGLFLPFNSFCRSTKIIRLQIAASKPLLKRIHSNIVKQKIRNQASTLRLIGKSNSYLLNLINRVRSGDANHIESQAAGWYFAELFGRIFSRQEDNIINAALNYGYAIFRGAISRGLVAHGLNPQLGFFHNNEQNAFNLADDLIEVFRAIIDLYVYLRLFSRNGGFGKNEKLALVSLLNTDVLMPQGKMSALNAIDYMVESVVRFYSSKNVRLDLPTHIGLESHFMES
jgi:CRISPR-associated protein Cas1